MLAGIQSAAQAAWHIILIIIIGFAIVLYIFNRKNKQLSTTLKEKRKKSKAEAKAKAERDAIAKAERDAIAKAERDARAKAKFEEKEKSTATTKDKEYSLKIHYINYNNESKEFDANPKTIKQSTPAAEWLSVCVLPHKQQINLKKDYITNLDTVMAALPKQLKSQITDSITIKYMSVSAEKKAEETGEEIKIPEFDLHLSSLIRKPQSKNFISAVTLDKGKREGQRLMFRIARIQSITVHKDNTCLEAAKEIAQFLQKKAKKS